MNTNPRVLELEAKLEEAERQQVWLTQLILALIRPGSTVALPVPEIRAAVERSAGLRVGDVNGCVVLEAPLRKSPTAQPAKPFRKLVQ